MMSREEIIEFEKFVDQRTALSGEIVYDAMQRFAEAEIGPGLAMTAMFLGSAPNHADQLTVEQELAYLKTLERYIDERCASLETRGVDVSRYEDLRWHYQMDLATEGAA